MEEHLDCSKMRFGFLQHSVSEEQILRCQSDSNVKDVMFAIAKQAVAHLEAVSICQ